jgi:hypothetical protein
VLSLRYLDYPRNDFNISSWRHTSRIASEIMSHSLSDGPLKQILM